MNIPQIQINQQFAQTGINIEKGDLRIEQPDADMNIRQPAAIVEISQEDTFVEIDNYPPRSDMHMKNNTDYLHYRRNSIDQQHMEFLARTARNGDRLMKIESEGNSIEQIAVEETFDGPVDLTVAYLSGPKFRHVPAELNIEIQPRGAEINFTPNKPLIDINRSRVNVHMMRYNNIDISVRGNNLNNKI
ncbi:DUF6470 family protein [Natronospora cellulosivora (SeqCode)]